MTSVWGKKKGRKKPLPPAARTALALEGARGAVMLSHFAEEEDDPQDGLPPGLYNAAVAIADKQRVLLLELKAALMTKDDAALRKAAAALVGYKDEKGSRTNSRKH
jgi:hypothetical protein